MPDDTAEESVIAALLESAGGCLHEISLSPEDFSSIPGEVLYRLIQDAVEIGMPADPVTIISATLKLEDGHRRLVSAERVWRLAGIYVPASAVEHHAGIVAQDATRRRLVNLATSIGQSAMEGQDLSALVDEAQAQLSGLRAAWGPPSKRSPTTWTPPSRGPTGPAAYVETPWRNLNDFVNGWKKGALYIIGARPSVGKTVAGFQAAVSLCNMGRSPTRRWK